MFLRVAIGFAALTAATSCVAPAGELVADLAPPVAAPATVAATRVVVPAGPSAMMLAPPPVSSAADIATNEAVIAPRFVAASQPGAFNRALDCLTAAVYYEARSQSLDGQEAVAQVVLNRVRNPAFPNSVCGTVYEGSSRSTGCQFTFTCDGSMAARIEPAAWERARRVAEAALSGFVYTPVGSATYYHTTAVSPWWAPKLTRVAQIGAHIFYRLPGSWGGSLAFDQHYSGIEPFATPGRLFREKSTAQIVDAVEAGVTIHRGASDDTGAATAAAATTESFGVRVHHGGSGGEAHQFGVTVHVIGGADADAISAT